MIKKIKRIRFDKGGEYITLNDYCENEGIIHEVTPPYSFELNGVAERKNETLKEMINSLLVSASIIGLLEQLSKNNNNDNLSILYLVIERYIKIKEFDFLIFLIFLI